ncbi:hypothetical protein EUGRSUZ_K00887 [Eucalyptus grandis]|uniref:Uncharacterized protein n=2 Tax=Eucalyptus grandis TaxID=71139 RepID=A0ACC3IRQ3_EUCGR|nr:hypothetical protein EUGRSUZ_K00887 [Eucalyptus grandis]
MQENCRFPGKETSHRLCRKLQIWRQFLRCFKKTIFSPSLSVSLLFFSIQICGRNFSPFSFLDLPFSPSLEFIKNFFPFWPDSKEKWELQSRPIQFRLESSTPVSFLSFSDEFAFDSCTLFFFFWERNLTARTVPPQNINYVPAPF